jgi:hypothetical protein
LCQVDEMKLHVRCKTPEDPAIVYITWKKKGQLGVCAKCWERIADKDWETGDSPKPTMEDILSDKARLGENPVETEYKLKGKKVDPNETENEEEDF